MDLHSCCFNNWIPNVFSVVLYTPVITLYYHTRSATAEKKDINLLHCSTFPFALFRILKNQYMLQIRIYIVQNQRISFELTAASAKSLPCKLLQSGNLEWL